MGPQPYLDKKKENIYSLFAYIATRGRILVTIYGVPHRSSRDHLIWSSAS